MGQYIPAPVGDSSPGVATGGLKGQYLRKASDLDYDTDWEDVVAQGGDAELPQPLGPADTPTFAGVNLSSFVLDGGTFN